MLDYEALDLRTFYSGAFVRFRGQFHRVAVSTCKRLELNKSFFVSGS